MRNSRILKVSKKYIQANRNDTIKLCRILARLFASPPRANHQNFGCVMAAAAVAATQLPSEAAPRKMGVKRIFAHLGEGSLFAGTEPRKRVRRGGHTIRTPAPSWAPRRIVRVRRTPVAMDVVPPERKRALTSSTPPPKRMRPTPRPTTTTPPPPTRVFYTAEMRAAQARKMSREPAPVPVRPMEEIEIEAEGAGTVPPRTYMPPPPSVHAAMLDDGRVAVRIVRENGMMQAVVIDPPEW